MNDEKMKGAFQKPEYMTSLSGKTLVSKTHGRIAFRGLIDTLQAEVIEAQVLASEVDEGSYCQNLGEILGYLRSLMAAEVKETPLAPPFLFGMDAEELHRKSHTPPCAKEKNYPGAKALFLPDHTQGPLAARLNTLRAKVREAELLAVKVFGPAEDGNGAEPNEASQGSREDIILALNRLSSALWVLYCKYVAERELKQSP